VTEPSTRTSDGSPRYFFMHLQKTAGTALWRRLQQEFDPVAVYPGPGDGDPPESVLSVPHLLARWRARRDDIRLVTGHFPMCTIELLDAPFATLTLLRDPVERTLSALRDLQERSPELRGAALEVIYDDPVRAPLLRNHMVRMLSLTPEEMSDGALTPIRLTDRHLERAQARLATTDVVGFQEQFDGFCDELGTRFGWDLGPPIYMNRTAPAVVSCGLRDRIAVDNALDVQLYEHAWSRHGRP
jgi:hypothetical protein